MNCSMDYEDQEVSKDKSPKVAVANKGNAKSSKPRPVTGSVSCQAPTQTLQECVGKPQLLGAMDRRLVGVSRIQERARKSGANKSTTKCQ